MHQPRGGEAHAGRRVPDAQVVLEAATGEEYAAVVSKDNPELTKALDAAIKKLQENGTIDQLQDKWF